MKAARALAVRDLRSSLLGLAGALAAAVFATACERPAGSGASPLYDASCLRCHGPEGKGGYASGVVQPPSFQDAAFQDSVSDDEIRKTIVEGRASAMPGFGSAFDDAQLNELVRAIRSFDARKRGETSTPP